MSSYRWRFAASAVGQPVGLLAVRKGEQQIKCDGKK
jgi:hypothetical protein